MASALRQDPCACLSWRARIILLTSGERAGDLSRVRELQINGYLLKPVEQEQLLETIIEVHVAEQIRKSKM